METSRRAKMQGPISNPDEPLSASHGYPEEWAAFSQRHQEFLKGFKNIETTIGVNFAFMAAITFVDTVVSHEAFTDRLLRSDSAGNECP